MDSILGVTGLGLCHVLEFIGAYSFGMEIGCGICAVTSTMYGMNTGCVNAGWAVMFFIMGFVMMWGLLRAIKSAGHD